MSEVEVAGATDETPDVNDMSEAELKVYENRVRRMAERQGLMLQKSRRRDPRAFDHGLYRIVDPYFNTVVAGGSPWDYSMSLDEVEESLKDDG